MYVCIYIRVWVCVCVWYVCVCLYVCMYVCLYECMYVCMYACVYVCMCVCQHFHTTSPLKPLGRLKQNFIMEPPWDGETKVCSNGAGHMTKMAAMPIYGKNLKNLLLQNPKADDLETWYAALGARVLLRLFKWWLWDDLDLFYGNVTFGPLFFCTRKM